MLLGTPSLSTSLSRRSRSCWLAIGLEAGLYAPHALTSRASSAEVAAASAACAEIAQGFGCSGFKVATAAEERERIWHARHHAYWASVAMKPGGRGFPTDVCVPISNLVECVERSKELVERHKLLSPIVGHVGDGNYHMMLMVDPSNAGACRAFHCSVFAAQRKSCDGLICIITANAAVEMPA